MAIKDPRQWSFDVDLYVNRLVPQPPWRHIPYPVARFMGYRHEGDKPREAGNLAPILWAFIGIFCSLALIEGVGMHIPEFAARSAPLIVGSFVSSILCHLPCTAQHSTARHGTARHGMALQVRGCT